MLRDAQRGFILHPDDCSHTYACTYSDIFAILSLIIGWPYSHSYPGRGMLSLGAPSMHMHFRSFSHMQILRHFSPLSVLLVCISYPRLVHEHLFSRCTLCCFYEFLCFLKRYQICSITRVTIRRQLPVHMQIAAMG